MSAKIEFTAIETYPAENVKKRLSGTLLESPKGWEQFQFARDKMGYRFIIKDQHALILHNPGTRWMGIAEITGQQSPDKWNAKFYEYYPNLKPAPNEQEELSA